MSVSLMDMDGVSVWACAHGRASNGHMLRACGHVMPLARGGGMPKVHELMACVLNHNCVSGACVHGIYVDGSLKCVRMCVDGHGGYAAHRHGGCAAQ